MNDLLEKPLYRQFTGKLVTIFVIAFLTISFATFLFYERDGQVSTLAELDYQEWQKYQQTQQLLLRQLSLLELVQQNKSFDNLLTNHHQLFSNLQLLSALELPQASQFESFIVQNEFMKQNVITIINSSARNIQLKQSTIIQLQLVVDSLGIESDKLNAQLLNFFQRIVNQQGTDQVDKNRVEAQVKSVQDLGVYQPLLMDFSNILSLFDRLNAQTSITEFEKMNKLAVLAFERYNIFINKDIDQRTDPELNAQLTTLENLLLKDQKTLTKWQEHLWLTQNYLASLNEQKQLLGNMLEDNKAPELASLTIFPASVNNESSIAGITLTPVMQNTLLTLVILFGTVALIFILFRLKKDIQLNASQTLLLYQKMVNKIKVQKIDAQSVADKQIAALTGKINKLLQREPEHQALEKSYQALMLSIKKEKALSDSSETQPTESELKEHEGFVEPIEPVEPDEFIEENTQKSSEENGIADEDSEEQYCQEQLINSVKIEEDSNEDDFNNTQAAFNLQNYANNQGSPEMAGYMLEEYLKSNRLHFEALKQAIKRKELNNAKESLQEILLVAKILDASKLQSICVKLNKAIATKKLKTVNSLLNKIEKALAYVTAYAEAI